MELFGSDYMKYSDLTKNRTFLKSKVPLATPFGLFIDPSNFCNFRCTFCPRNLPEFHDFAGSFSHMQMDLFRKIISDIHQFKEKIKAIRLYYLGEPLLNPNFVEMLNLVMSENITERVEITTNASLLTNGISDSILTVAQRNTEVMLYMRYSIYSPLQAHNQKITRNSVNVAVIRNNVANFQQMRNERKISNVSTYAKMIDTFDIEENNTFKIMYENIVDDINLEEPMNWSGAEKTNLLKEEYGGDSDKLTKRSMSFDKRTACQYPFTTLAINPDGSVIACCVDWSRKTLLGNVNTEHLIDIWNGEKLRKLRCIHLDGNRCFNDACRNCERLPVFMPGHEADDLSGLTSIEFLNREKT